MTLALISTFMLAGDLRVEGLTPSEHFVVLSAARAEDGAEHLQAIARGRLVDAHTGWPIAGVRIEAWTEEISQKGRGFHCVGESASGRDGQFSLRVRDGGLIAEKIRASAPGYLTYPGTLSDLDVVRLVPARWTPRIAVTDLLDGPIAGARLTSTYSCSHDLPAFDRCTDALGLVEIPEYGWQDHAGELRVRAAGYGAIEYLEGEEVLPDARMLETGGAAQIRLGRRREIRARLLDEHGQPLVAEAVRLDDGEGCHVAFTDEDGRFEVRSSYEGRELTICMLRETENAFVFAGRLPILPAMTLRMDSEGYANEQGLGRLRVELSGAIVSEAVPAMQLFHADGWTAELPAQETEVETDFPAGRAWLLAGRSFSGIEEELLEVIVEEGSTRTLELELRREPALAILTPPGEANEILVEAGEDSTRVGASSDGVQLARVPAGRPVAILSRGARTRRLVLGPLAADTTADLRSEACLLPLELVQSLAVRERVSFRVELRGADGAACPGDLSARGAGSPEVERLADAAFRVSAPAGAQVLLAARCEGRAGCWESVMAPAQAPASRRSCSAPRSSRTWKSSRCSTSRSRARSSRISTRCIPARCSSSCASRTAAAPHSCSSSGPAS